jgi:Nucleotide modification associated domain 2/Nucleotide modification associated domain 3
MNAQLKKGDWLIGNSPKKDGNRLVYAMRISDVLSMNQYFHNKQFEAKKPKPDGTLIEQCGDNIYYQRGVNQWTRLPSPFHNSRKNFEKDVGHHVFVAEHFYYFGRRRVAIPDNLREVIQDRQGIHYKKDRLADDFVAWLEANHKPGILGTPLDMEDRSAETDPILTDLNANRARQALNRGRSNCRPKSNQTQQRQLRPPLRIALLRVGIDSGSGGMDGPLFADGRFEYVPIPDSKGLDERTYGNHMARTGGPLSSFFPPARQAAMRSQSMHLDPEFTSFTYGDPTPPKAGLRRLAAGDLLVFYAGLRGYGCDMPPGLYLIGYFEVAFAGFARDLTEEQIRACSDNFHVRHESVFRDQRDRLVLVKGGAGSRLLTKAVKISVLGQDRAGKPLKVLSPDMQQIFGGFDGKLSFQRSPTRWVLGEHISAAACFVRGLS